MARRMVGQMKFHGKAVLTQVLMMRRDFLSRYSKVMEQKRKKQKMSHVAKAGGMRNSGVR